MYVRTLGDDPSAASLNLTLGPVSLTPGALDWSSGAASAPAPTSSSGSLSDAVSSFFSSLTNAAPAIASSVLSVQQMQQLNNINAQRVARGLAPLSPQQAGLVGPQVGVNAGLSPELQQTANWGLIGVLGLGAFAIFMLSGNKRRGR